MSGDLTFTQRKQLADDALQESRVHVTRLRTSVNARLNGERVIQPGDELHMLTQIVEKQQDALEHLRAMTVSR